MVRDFIPPAYDPAAVEKHRYRYWLKGNYFRAAGKGDEKTFTIVIPPPNITGSLHMGHALDITIQDTLIRWRRMLGDDALWLPGTDHAGIATQIRVEEDLAGEGLTRHQLGREGFLEKVWEWKEIYHRQILGQLYSLGASCDWSRERFTMDEGCSRAVRKVFVDLYRAGLIYRGNYMINWCPRCHTALSDIEVEHEEIASTLTHIRYPLAGGDGYIVVATTRPESMLGDSGVAVHPEDQRYIDLVGREVVLPLLKRKIPIVADEYVDPAFGSGAVKVTPAHDPNDFEIGRRHDLELIPVIGEEGKMTAAAGPYAGLERELCREKVVAALQAEGLIEKIEEYSHAVGHCHRCHTVVEPLISRQWFVRMKPLAGPALEAVRSGETVFVPARFSHVYENWLENIRDWCISRQLWWGHRIPAWYCSCGEIIVDYDDPVSCPSCGSGSLEQDPDVLDTWFSSALWPFSTLGWPEKSADLERYFPTDVLVTAYDIIFFWVARMIFMSLYFMKEVPFKVVYIHGLVRDAEGRKMSKSLGNGIDPLEVIAAYGADTLRFSLITGQAPGNDQRFRHENVEAARNFANKIWNGSRFVLMNLSDEPGGATDYIPFQPDSPPEGLTVEDRWILHRCNRAVEQISAALEGYEPGEAARLVYEFLWNDFCDWYVELSKGYLYSGDGTAASRETRRRTRGILLYVLDRVLRLLHPFMPFISEEIWHYLPQRETALIVSSWPQPHPRLNYPAEAAAVTLLQEAIRAVRNLRSRVQLPPGREAPVILRPSADAAAVLESGRHQLSRLAFAAPLTIDPSAEKPRQALAEMIGDQLEVYLPLAGVIDLEAERSRLGKELQQLEKELLRTRGKLENPRFMKKAPPEIVGREKARLKERTAKKEKLEARIQELQ
ncbi:MAG: valine--tRNA ligase [Firmicutes bacterium]|nr:valine--tRNA ligase [Bacillota bacterium]